MCGGALWFWCMYKCNTFNVWCGWGIIRFLLAWVATPGHSQPQLLKCPFGNYAVYFHSICAWNIHKNPSYCETSPDGSLEKIQICVPGKSFCLVCWRMLNNRGWMIPVTTLDPKLSLPICAQQHHTLYCCMLIIHFSVAPISLHYTSIIQIQRAHNSKEYIVAIYIFSKAGQCNVWGNLSGRFSMTRYRVLARPTTQLYLKLVFPPNSTVYSKT